MSFAVVRIRGTVNINEDIRDTLKLLRLNRVNHCVIIPDSPISKGMLNKVKDYVTWGEIDPDTLTVLLHRYGFIGGERMNDKTLKKHSGFKSLRTFAKALCDGEVVLTSIKTVKPVLRLHPPRGGYEGVKRPFADGGALGYRGKEMVNLLIRMAPDNKHNAEKAVKKDGGAVV